MKKLIAAIAIIGLVLGAMFIWQSGTAAADNQDNNSLWGCASQRTGSDYVVDHSWWDGLYPGFVTGRCMTHNIYTGHQVCYRLTWYVNEGIFQGSAYDTSPPCWFNAH